MNGIKALKLLCLVLVIFSLSILAVSANSVVISETKSNENSVTIYYPNGDWQYESVNIAIDDKCENKYLCALNNMIQGVNIPNNCIKEIPEGFIINSFNIKGKTALIDIQSNVLDLFNDMNYSIDITFDILIFNIFELSNVDEILFTFNNKTLDNFKFSYVQRSKYYFIPNEQMQKEIPKEIKAKQNELKKKFSKMTKEEVEKYLHDEINKREQKTIESYSLATYDPPVSTIVIVPGHGGSQTGATGTLNGTTYLEKNINLSVSLALREYLLEHDYTVLMTRTTDIERTLSYRYNYANNNNADLFISVHHNGSSNTSANGTTCLYPNNHDIQESKDCSYWIHHFVALFNLDEHRVPYNTDPKDVTKYTQMPAMITETGFMTNEYDLSYLVDQSNREDIAESIHLGVQYWDVYGEYWY